MFEHSSDEQVTSPHNLQWCFLFVSRLKTRLREGKKEKKSMKNQGAKGGATSKIPQGRGLTNNSGNW
jgi:hypothetical protein